MINNNDVFINSCIDGNIICIIFLYFIIDLDAQLVMIDKLHDQKLGLIIIDLEPYLFTIITLIRDMKQTINYTMQ